MNALPFLSVEKAIFWAIAVDTLKKNPRAREPHWARIERVCDYTDILREISRLRLSKRELEVVAKFGRAGRTPGKDDHAEEARMWDLVMDRLRTTLTTKGIVVNALDVA